MTTRNRLPRQKQRAAPPPTPTPVGSHQRAPTHPLPTLGRSLPRCVESRSGALLSRKPLTAAIKAALRAFTVLVVSELPRLGPTHGRRRGSDGDSDTAMCDSRTGHQGCSGGASRASPEISIARAAAPAGGYKCSTGQDAFGRDVSVGFWPASSLALPHRDLTGYRLVRAGQTGALACQARISTDRRTRSRNDRT